MKLTSKWTPTWNTSDLNGLHFLHSHLRDQYSSIPDSNIEMRQPTTLNKLDEKYSIIVGRAGVAGAGRLWRGLYRAAGPAHPSHHCDHDGHRLGPMFCQTNSSGGWRLPGPAKGTPAAHIAGRESKPVLGYDLKSYPFANCLIFENYRIKRDFPKSSGFMSEHMIQ